MRITKAVICSWIALASCARSPQATVVAPGDERNFRISSLGEGYPMLGEALGSYRVEGDTLLVTVVQGRFRSNVPTQFGEAGVLSDLRLRAGIGVPTETGWRVESRSTEEPITASLAPQQEVRFEDFTFAVPIVEGAVLRDGWLHFALIGSHTGLYNREPGRIASYMCQTENLLGATRESRDRAARMRQAYTTIC
jgi:hypothetical protein